MNRKDQLLDQFIDASIQMDVVVESHAGQVCISPFVHQAINSARKVLPLLEDQESRNRVVSILHDIYTELRRDIKRRGTVINGKKHPALDASQQAYRIISA